MVVGWVDGLVIDRWMDECMGKLMVGAMFTSSYSSRSNCKQLVIVFTLFSKVACQEEEKNMMRRKTQKKMYRIEEQ